MSNIVQFTSKGSQHYQELADLVREIKDVIYKHADTVSLAAALGVLVIVQKELIDEH